MSLHPGKGLSDPKQCPCDSHAALSTGQTQTTLTDHGIIPLWKPHNKIMRIRMTGNLFYLLPCSVGFAIANIITNAARKEYGLLGHNSNLLSEMVLL